MKSIDDIFSVETKICFGGHTFTYITWRDTQYTIMHPHPDSIESKVFRGFIHRPLRCLNSREYEGDNFTAATLEEAVQQGKSALLAEFSWVYDELCDYASDLRKFMTESEIRKL